MSSDEQTAANQQNAQASTGPHDTSQTSQNAITHGLLAKGITKFDGPEYAKLAGSLQVHFRPVGPIEDWLVEQIGLLMVRIQRAVAIDKHTMADLLPDANAGASKWYSIRKVMNEFNLSVGRYETALENKLYRALHELERQQRLREGENVPPPAVADVNVHGEVAADPTHAESSQPPTQIGPRDLDGRVADRGFVPGSIAQDEPGLPGDPETAAGPASPLSGPTESHPEDTHPPTSP